MKQVTEQEFLARPDPIFETAAHGEPVAILRDGGCADAVLISKAMYELCQRLAKEKTEADFEALFARYGDALRALADR